MPEGPRTIHIFMNFLQCYSLWRTLFEPNHREYRVDLLNWHEHSCPTFKMPAPRLFCIRFEHNDRVQTFLGRRTICLSSRMTCLSSRISGTVVREICPRWKFFRLLATARLMAQRYWEGLTSLQRKWTSQYGRPNFRHNCQIGANWRGAPIINFRPLCGRNWRTLLLIVGPAK